MCRARRSRRKQLKEDEVRVSLARTRGRNVNFDVLLATSPSALPRQVAQVDMAESVDDSQAHETILPWSPFALWAQICEEAGRSARARIVTVERETCRRGLEPGRARSSASACPFRSGRRLSGEAGHAGLNLGSVTTSERGSGNERSCRRCESARVAVERRKNERTAKKNGDRCEGGNLHVVRVGAENDGICGRRVRRQEDGESEGKREGRTRTSERAATPRQFRWRSA